MARSRTEIDEANPENLPDTGVTSRGIAGLDLESLPDEDLDQLIERAQEILARRVRSQLEQFRSIARRAGFEMSLSKVGEGTERRRGRGANNTSASIRPPVAPKYRNPNNPAETWSGRGRKPRWLEQELGSGRDISEFAISSP